ncbi:MAG: flagellar biosynthesis protein FlhF [Rhodanobacter sp.]|nr:MAG: flagellar biosynthesis protein FlhF [Rhodanobacter sp.]TAM13799.1 MAG: flagellar biosynthesis protein FlhF [Rhodanobacter sp.]TAM37710.1 MAG: flagellar biosynthesis protein FlhF [Rhodanobacter sp.]
MKIKRFVASDMRQAMREVREEQGPEAVILSTRRVADGIEVIAAIDYDEALVREAVRQGTPRDELPEVAAATRPAAVPPLPPPPPPLPVRAAPPAPPMEPAAQARLARVTARVPRPAPAVSPRMPSHVAVAAAEGRPPAPFADAARETAQLRSEVGDLRELLEGQLSSLGWNDLERRRPLRARVLRELTRLGIEADVARRLADELPDDLTAEQARYLPLGLLSRSLTVSGRSLCGDERGVMALVGPTGVGKTTTIAKLAARAVMRHGAAQVALVSTDHYRIGAAAQLEHYGRLLGVQVYPAYDAKSLRKVLDMLAGRHAVLIDTAGMAASDPRLTQQLELLSGAGALRVSLVLAAHAQVQALEEAVGAYRRLQPQACILSKLDEAPALGGALSVLIRQQLALDFTTDGQRVPEDIAQADARALVCRTVQSLRGSAPDDGVMAERFGLAMVGA